MWTSTPSYESSNNTVHSTRFLYDLAGDTTDIWYPDGRHVTQGWDAAEHLNSVAYADWNGQAVNASYLNSTSFEPTGQMIAGVLGNGVQVASSFNPRQTIASLQYKTASQTLWSKQYTWAANAQNLIQLVDTTSSPQTYYYSYDPDNRLVSASGGGQTLVSPATSGTGNVSISGTEKVTSYLPPGCRQRSCSSTIYDSGAITLTVNNYSYRADYGQGSTSSSIASALAAQISNDANSPVSASSSGSIVYLTAKATGAVTNYSLTASSSWNSQSFSSPSFTTSASGASLTGA